MFPLQLPVRAMAVGCLVLFLAAPLRGAEALSIVHVIPAPPNSLVPDVQVDTQGAVHMVYGLDHSAWYIRSADNGRTFTAPVKINSVGEVTTTMGERGPKIALGRDNVIHVVWADRWTPGAKCYVRHARRLDGGKTFQPPQQVSVMPGVDGASLAADSDGNVLAFWHVMADPKPAEPSATWLHMARSTDNGVAFGPSDKVNVTQHTGVACSMCMMRPRIAPDGNVYLAFRSAQDNVRDFFVLKSPKTQNRFTAIRVNQDNWKLEQCPMCGPELTLAPAGQAICAYMSRNRVYWSISDQPLTRFDLHVPTPTNENNEIYPTALANRRGQVLLLWQVGPMSVKSTAIVKWATYSIDGKPTGQHGTIGTSFSGTKPTAFVGTDDNFYIVTTAHKFPA